MPTSSQARMVNRWDLRAMSRQMQGEANANGLQYSGQADVAPSSGNIDPGQNDVTTSPGNINAGQNEVTLSHADVTSSHADVTPSDGNIIFSQADVIPCYAEVTSCHADVTSCPADVCLGYADGPLYAMAGYRWWQADAEALTDMFGGASLNNSNIDNNEGGEDDAPPPPPPAGQSSNIVPSSIPEAHASEEGGAKPDHSSRRTSKSAGRVPSRKTLEMQDRKTPRMEQERRASRMEQDRKTSKIELRKKGTRESGSHRSPRMKAGGHMAQSFESDSSSSRSASRSFQFEIDLLHKGSNDSIGPEPEPEQPFSSSIDRLKPNPDDESVDTPKPGGKTTMKHLFKQLMSLGISSNAFRGITVTTSTGESKAATEEEANEALDAMVTDMVPEEDEDDDDDEDMELVMGSLLCDVGSHIEVETKPESRAKSKPKPRPDLLIPLETGPVSKSAGSPLSPQPKQASGGQPPRSGPPPPPVSANMDLSEVKDLLVPKASEADPNDKPKKDTQLDFLNDVVSGSAFVSGKAGKTAAAAKPTGEPKKKVIKIPPMRLRRTMPITNPTLLCIRTPNVDLTHEQVKNMLDAQLGIITSLQHVPEYLQSGSIMLQPRVMWIFSMEDTSTNNYVRICTDGIMGYDGEKLRIRLRDDIFTEEYRAFHLVQQIKNEQANMKSKKEKLKQTQPKTRSPVPS